MEIQKIKALLSYDASTGIFTWNRGRKAVGGTVAGCKKTDSGYVIIMVAGVVYYAHRLAWAFMHGAWPKQIDHANGDRADNRISNLRESIGGNGNQSNAKKRSPFGQATSLYKGVYWSKQKKKWHALIHPNYRTIHLGFFTSEIDAARAYDVAAVKNYGEFAMANFRGSAAVSPVY